MKTHPMWVCDKCKFSQYHPMIYCPRCPGRLSCQKIPLPPPARFETTEELRAHIKSQGLDYEGEFAKFDKDGKMIRPGI